LSCHSRARQPGQDLKEAAAPPLEEAKRHLKRARAPFHRLAPDDVTRDKVKDRMKELTDTSGPIRPKRAHAYLSTFYAWLIHNNQCGGANPCMGIKLGKEEPRSRTLSEPELVDVWLAAGEDDFGVIVKLLILTGQRLREIGDLEWLEIDLEKRQSSCRSAERRTASLTSCHCPRPPWRFCGLFRAMRAAGWYSPAHGRLG